MKDYLLDIVDHVLALGGVIKLIRIDGDDKSTTISGISDDRSVVLSAKFKEPLAEFKGSFGLPNLPSLNTLLHIQEYQKDAKLYIENKMENNEEIPSTLHFENATGDFKNSYRFMTGNIINDKLKQVKFKGVTWDIEFEPSQQAHQRFKFQTQIHPDEKVFTAKTENSDLKFYFGDHSTTNGSFVFQNGVNGTLSAGTLWPVLIFTSILGMSGTKTVRFSNEGAAEITVDSGLIEYHFILPQQTK